MSSTLNDETYFSSSIGSFDSRETFAIRLAKSCITLKGPVSSSLSLVAFSLCDKEHEDPVKQTLKVYLFIKNETTEQSHTLFWSKSVEHSVKYELGKE